MKRLRLAVVGAGHLGQIHARLAAAHPQFQLTAVVDPVAAARESLAAAHQVTAHAAYAPLIGNVDAAIIATPTRFHHAVARELLEAGVHLLVEKPLAATAAEADDLVQTAERQGCVLQVGHVERFNPVLAEVADYLERPKYIEARRYCAHTFRSTDIGVVLDLMIHDLDLVLSMVRGPLRSVSALGVTVFGPHEDVATARLEFADGCVANLSASRVSYHTCREMQVWSQRGCAAIDFATRSAKCIHPATAVLQGELQVDGLAPTQRQQLRDRLFTDLLPLSNITAAERNALADEQTDFAESIVQARAPRVTGQQALAALLAAEQVLGSIARHAWEGTPDGRRGADAARLPDVLTGPHWHRNAEVAPPPRRQAG